MNIGLFDSGLGGITILKAVAKALPEYDYSYYGDTKNLPYGDKTEAEIYEYSKTAMRYLFEQGSALIIIACNTASAETLRKLQVEFLPTEYPDRKILGVIIPTIEVLIESGVEAALLIATKRTVESYKYEKELQTRASTLTLSSKATPTLVPLIEAGSTNEAVTEAISIIDSIRETKPELATVILGCTHYTELTEGLRTHYQGDISFISQNEILPDSLALYLQNHQEITTKLRSEGKRTIHLTEHRPDYDRIISQLLGGAFLPEEV